VTQTPHTCNASIITLMKMICAVVCR